MVSLPQAEDIVMKARESTAAASLVTMKRYQACAEDQSDVSRVNEMMERPKDGATNLQPDMQTWSSQ